MTKLNLTESQRAERLRWAEALESESFGQCQLAMKTVENNGRISYCCLGVAAHLNNYKFRSTQDNLYGVFDPEEGSAWHGILPDSLMAKLGLTNDEQSALVFFNDTLMRQFVDIAAAIRRSVDTDEEITRP